MTADLFALPFPGRCVTPQPAPRPRSLETGCRVVWSRDREEGTVVESTPDSIAVYWDESGYHVYARCSLAVRENIVALDTRPAEPGPF